MPHPILRVNLGSRSYDIAFVQSALTQVAAFARERGKSSSALIVADEKVAASGSIISQAFQDNQVRTRLVILPSGEGQKSLKVAESLYDQLIDIPADRRTLVVAVGGGVVGDLSGFVAATYARGLPLLMVPSTLLAMVDSSVGGKVAVNHPRAKNMIGVFHQPIGVWIDISLLNTLPDREFHSGLAEVVKYGVILDPDFFDYLEAHREYILRRDAEAIECIVRRSCELKAKVVEQDEREEHGLRAILNYGHTFAHAFETAGGYGHWLHGEAVAAGMVCASRLAEKVGLISQEITERQIDLLRAYHLPIRVPRWDAQPLLATMRADKKSLGGKLRFILPTRIGEVKLVDGIDERLVLDVLSECMEK